MTTLTIRNVDESTRRRLKMMAAAKGHSMEAELREIVAKATIDHVAQPKRNIGRAIHQRFQRHGGVELDLPPRTKERPIPDFGE